MTLTFRQIESLIAKLSFVKKTALLQSLSRDLGSPFSGIEKTKDVAGGSACVIRTRIPVWALVSFKKQGLSDKKLLEAYPTLRQQDLNNVWAHYKVNKKEIQEDIRSNNEV